jgi:hypothetical protein
MARALLLLCCLTSLVSVAAPKKAPPPPPPPPPTAPMTQVQEHLAEKVRGTLTTATKVTAWRVAGSGGLRPDPARAIGADFNREGAGVDLAADQLAALRGVLYDDKSYRFEADVAQCAFRPNVSFRFEAGLDVVEVVLSFGCNYALFYVGKPGGRWLPSGTFDVRPARAALLALAKATLRDDAVTQKLK